MNIEEAIKYIKNDIEIDKDTASWFENGNMTKEQIEESIDAYETLLTAYEKEKGENVKLRLQDIPLIEGELKAYKDRVNELKQELEKEKEKNKEILSGNIESFQEYFSEEFNAKFISKDKIKEILGIEETDSEKILSLLQTIVDENARLEDIEDRKVQIEYNNVFNKGVKSVEDKIKTKIEEVKDGTYDAKIVLQSFL